LIVGSGSFLAEGMVFPMATLLRSSVSVLILLFITLFLSGCHSSAPARVSASAVSVRAMSPTSPHPDPRLQAIARVQSLPLYLQAKSSCQQHQYKQAADLLDRLASTPGLNAIELKFCREQRDLCLADAGMPVSLQDAKTPSRSHEIRGGRADLGCTKCDLATQRTHQESVAASADCGPRALLLACDYLDIKADLPTLSKQAGMTQRGVSFQGLAQAALATGLKAEAVQLSREALSDARMPAIGWVNGNHFIAILRLQGSGESGTAVIHDPNQPTEMTISQEQLLRMSSGYLLLLHR